MREGSQRWGYRHLLGNVAEPGGDGSRLGGAVQSRAPLASQGVMRIGEDIRAVRDGPKGAPADGRSTIRLSSSALFRQPDRLIFDPPGLREHLQRLFAVPSFGEAAHPALWT